MNRSTAAGFAALMLGMLADPCPAQAARPLTRPQILIWDASSPTDLRRSLRAFGDSAASGDSHGRLDAGEALTFLAGSYQREGHLDSALVSFRRAVALRGDRPERLSLADLLLGRGTPAAVAEARHALADDLQQAAGESPMGAAQLFGRLAWAQAQTGQADSAVALISEWAAPLARDPLWAKRFASIAIDAGQQELAWRMALPVAVRARGTDPGAMDLLRRSATQGGSRMDPSGVVAREVAKRDSSMTLLRNALGARKLVVRTKDGFPLAVTFLPPRSAVRPRVVVLLAQASDTLAVFDSLAVQLARQGVAVAIVDPRGTRESVAAPTWGMDTWHGRESAFLDRTARDATETLDALIRLKLADPRRALLGATGTLAFSAAQAAARDPRFAAVMLITPAPAAVDRGALRASFQKSAVPLFIQVAPEDVEAMLLADRLAGSLPLKQTRVADTNQSGRSAALFRADRKAVERLLTWWKDVPLRPATRPSRRR